jgi:hypothetical protein
MHQIRISVGRLALNTLFTISYRSFRSRKEVAKINPTDRGFGKTDFLK